MIGWNAAAKGKTLADKAWDDHLVVKDAAGTPTSSTSTSTSCTRSPARKALDEILERLATHETLKPEPPTTL